VDGGWGLARSSWLVAAGRRDEPSGSSFHECRAHEWGTKMNVGWTFRSTNGGAKAPPYIKAEEKDREWACDRQVIATVPYNTSANVGWTFRSTNGGSKDPPYITTEEKVGNRLVTSRLSRRFPTTHQRKACAVLSPFGGGSGEVVPR